MNSSVSPGIEADVPAVVLNLETDGIGKTFYFDLIICPDGKQDTAQLILVQPVEEIRLVLAPVAAFQQMIIAVEKVQPGVVPRRQVVEPFR